MHCIDVTKEGNTYTLVVDGLVVLCTTNSNVARAYAQEAKRHYTTSSQQYVIVPEDPHSKTSVRT